MNWLPLSRPFRCERWRRWYRSRWRRTGWREGPRRGRGCVRSVRVRDRCDAHRTYHQSSSDDTADCHQLFRVVPHRANVLQRNRIWDPNLDGSHVRHRRRSSKVVSVERHRPSSLIVFLVLCGSDYTELCTVSNPVWNSLPAIRDVDHAFPAEEIGRWGWHLFPVLLNVITLETARVTFDGPLGPFSNPPT